MAYYRHRLARIHAQDYTMFALAAGDLLRAEPPGTVLDVGCGAGDLLSRLPGWDYIGVDASPDMIALARRRFPQARFIEADARDLPGEQVTAIVAIGEVLNYTTDLAGLVQWAVQARQRLGPGGVLLIDIAGPLRADPEPTTRVTNAEGYRLEVTTCTDPQRRTLTRTITVTDEAGTETETHTLHLMEPVDVMAALRSAGFDVTPLEGYREDLPFPRGWSGFLGRVILDS